MTPYWSIKDSSNKSLSLDQIVVSDTGGIGANIDLKTGFNYFFEIHHPLLGSNHNNHLNSVKKRLFFKSQEFDPDFVSSQQLFILLV